MRGAFLLLVASFCISAYSDELDRLMELYGSSDVVTLSGNGGLTVGVNNRGTIALCRWPSPSHFDQLTYHSPAKDSIDSEGHPDHGLQWGVEIDSKVLWGTGAEWEIKQGYLAPDSTVAVTTATRAGTDQKVTQTVVVDPARDLLAIRYTFTNFSSAPVLYWYANFTPCTRKLPELPIADWGSFDRFNDFAVFSTVQPPRIVHFRPTNPGSELWGRADALAANSRSALDWAAFPAGTWIAYTTPDPVMKLGCMGGKYPSETLRSALTQSDRLPRAALGETASLMAVYPSPTGAREYSATIFVTFGKDLREVGSALAEVESRSFATMLDTVREDERNWLAEGRANEIVDVELREMVLRCLLTLRTATDRETGAMVRSPLTQPALARDWPRHGVWMNYALDIAGYSAMAKQHSLFYASLVRDGYRRSKPPGSMPGAVYTDGEEATPHLIVDTEAVAAFLWDGYRHADTLAPEDRIEYLASIWPAVSLGADFLAGWSDGRTERPLQAFDPALGRDAQSGRQYILTRRGLMSALEIAETLEQPAPASWVRRKSGLDVLLQTLLLDEATEWGTEVPLPFVWPTSSGARLSEVFERRLWSVVDNLRELDAFEALRAIVQAANMWRNDRAKLDRLSPHLKESLGKILENSEGNESGSVRKLDALVAAYGVIGAFLIEEESR